MLSLHSPGCPLSNLPASAGIEGLCHHAQPGFVAVFYFHLCVFCCFHLGLLHFVPIFIENDL